MALGEAMTELVERAGVVGRRGGHRLEFEGGYEKLVGTIRKRVNELKSSLGLVDLSGYWKMLQPTSSMDGEDAKGGNLLKIWMKLSWA